MNTEKQLPMTKGEILAMYKDRPNAKRIQEIADKNNVTANEIRKILHDAGEDVAVFGPGRPKKSDSEKVEGQNLTKADDVLNDEEENMLRKAEATKLQLRPEDIPDAVIKCLHERIANINRQIQVYVECVDALNTERNALVDFLERGTNEQN